MQGARRRGDLDEDGELGRPSPCWTLWALMLSLSQKQREPLMNNGCGWRKQIQIWKDAPLFFSFLWDDSALSDGTWLFLVCALRTWLLWSELSFCSYHSVRFSSTSSIKAPSSTRSRLCSRLTRPLDLAVVSLGKSNGHGEAPANTLTSVPCSPRLCMLMTFLFYSSSSLLWPCSRLYDHSEWCILLNASLWVII